MNVRLFPGAGTDAGGFAAILLMVVAISGLYVMFRKQDWL
jgi:Mg2+ and Co2+ transporter CorA